MLLRKKGVAAAYPCFQILFGNKDRRKQKGSEPRQVPSLEGSKACF